MESKLWARDIFMQYRNEAMNRGQTLIQLRSDFPLAEFPKIQGQFEKAATLAVLWGEVATILGGRTVDYIQNWRTGQ